MRRWASRLMLLIVAVVLLWQPVLKPAGQATILIADIYTEPLIGTNVARLVTPEPRVSESTDEFAGVAMRVTYWRPAWGDRHPAVVIVPGATVGGNDEPAVRSFGVWMQRSRARALPETQGRSVGAFGASVGGGMLLVAAGQKAALRSAAFIAILGAYNDIDTYLASLASHMQLLGGRLEPWERSQERSSGFHRLCVISCQARIRTPCAERWSPPRTTRR